MPAGPSHSHSHSSGGGHSHSSGGGSFGGSRSSFGGSYGGGFGGMRPRRPIHMHFFGHSVIISGGKQTALAILLILCIMASFFSFGLGMALSQNKSDLSEEQFYLNQMVEDNKDYKEYIEKAKEAEESGIDNGYYTTYAEFRKEDIRYDYYSNNTPAIYYFDDYGAMEIYYIVYEYINDHQIDEDTGEKVVYTEQTYAQFTQNDALKLSRNGKIKIVYHYDETDEKWYSINYDYPKDITTSFEYRIREEFCSDMKSSIGFLSVAFTVALLVAIGSLVGIILSIVLAAKKTKKEAELEAEKKKAEIREKQANADAAEEELKKKNRVCDYCGCSVPDGANKCPVCGASKFKKKN